MYDIKLPEGRSWLLPLPVRRFFPINLQIMQILYKKPEYYPIPGSNCIVDRFTTVLNIESKLSKWLFQNKNCDGIITPSVILYDFQEVYN